MARFPSFLVRSQALRTALLLTVALGSTSNAALAICSTAPSGAVATPIAQLLSKYPNGGGALVSEVRNLVATTSDGLTSIIALTKSANAEQKSAIGAGLGQAAGVCARPDPDTARAIQEAILSLDSRDVSVAYQAATGDRETGSVGSGAGGGGGGGLGGGGTQADTTTSGANNGFYANSTTSVLNLIQSYNPGSAYASLVESSSASPSTSVSQSR